MFAIKQCSKIIQKQKQCVWFRSVFYHSVLMALFCCCLHWNLKVCFRLLGLFVLPTISSLIASLNRKIVQYFRANILCKSCHSFHSLRIDRLRLIILEMKLGSKSILKTLMPLVHFKIEEPRFQAKALSFSVGYFWSVWLEILQTCISEAVKAPTPGCLLLWKLPGSEGLC